MSSVPPKHFCLNDEDLEELHNFAVYCGRQPSTIEYPASGMYASTAGQHYNQEEYPHQQSNPHERRVSESARYPGSIERNNTRKISKSSRRLRQSDEFQPGSALPLEYPQESHIPYRQEMGRLLVEEASPGYASEQFDGPRESHNLMRNSKMYRAALRKAFDKLMSQDDEIRYFLFNCWQLKPDLLESQGLSVLEQVLQGSPPCNLQEICSFMHVAFAISQSDLEGMTRGRRADYHAGVDMFGRILQSALDPTLSQKEEVYLYEKLADTMSEEFECALRWIKKRNGGSRFERYDTSPGYEDCVSIVDVASGGATFREFHPRPRATLQTSKSDFCKNNAGPMSISGFYQTVLFENLLRFTEFLATVDSDLFHFANLAYQSEEHRYTTGIKRREELLGTLDDAEGEAWSNSIAGDEDLSNIFDIDGYINGPREPAPHSPLNEFDDSAPESQTSDTSSGPIMSPSASVTDLSRSPRRRREGKHTCPFEGCNGRFTNKSNKKRHIKDTHREKKGPSFHCCICIHRRAGGRGEENMRQHLRECHDLAVVDWVRIGAPHEEPRFRAVAVPIAELSAARNAPGEVRGAIGYQYTYF